MNSGHGVTLDLPPREVEAEDAPKTPEAAPLLEVADTFGGLPDPEWKAPFQRRVEGYWYKSPSLPDQELTHPHTVSKGPFQTQILWLDNPLDVERYAELLSNRLKDGTIVEVSILDREFVAARETWVVLAVFRPILYKALMSA